MINNKITFLCPKCRIDTNVLQSMATGVNSRRRRRQCPACGFEFLTIQKPGNKEEFDCPVVEGVDRTTQKYQRKRERVSFLRKCVNGQPLLEEALERARQKLGIMGDGE